MSDSLDMRVTLAALELDALKSLNGVKYREAHYASDVARIFRRLQSYGLVHAHGSSDGTSAYFLSDLGKAYLAVNGEAREKSNPDAKALAEKIKRVVCNEWRPRGYEDADCSAEVTRIRELRVQYLSSMSWFEANTRAWVDVLTEMIENHYK
jgi:hypothetical protein